MATTTWRAEISSAMHENGESWSDVESCTLSESQLDAEFDAGYGTAEGMPFTLWTRKRVYFPWTYDGAEGATSVPRNPCDEAKSHVGG